MTESGKRRVILPFAGGLAETNHVIGHELVHAFQSFAGGDRDWVRSAGVALRANVLGYAIAEIDYVRPFDRSRRGWIWQFSLTPGF